MRRPKSSSTSTPVAPTLSAKDKDKRVEVSSSQPRSQPTSAGKSSAPSTLERAKHVYQRLKGGQTSTKIPTLPTHEEEEDQEQEKSSSSTAPPSDEGGNEAEQSEQEEGQADDD